MKIKSLKLAAAAVAVAASVSLPASLKAKSTDSVPAAIELKTSILTTQAASGDFAHSSHSSHASHASHSSHYSSSR